MGILFIRKEVVNIQNSFCKVPDQAYVFSPASAVGLSDQGKPSGSVSGNGGIVAVKD
jgi:hypothetical protein